MAKGKVDVVVKKTGSAPAPQHVAPPRKDGMRETVESVVIAFVLAFLFRAFEAEAFVIPTGSMAPTLMGVHKDVTCGECGTPYRISASEEQDETSERLRSDMSNGRLPLAQRDHAAQLLAGQDVVSGICPNCRFQMNLDPQTDDGRKYPTFKGDRILVSKFPYDFSDPERWDVVVFKYPQTANENYIKRCVGLPNETVVIHGGNIYTRPLSGGERTIARKSPEKVRAIMQKVYDNDYVMPELVAAGLPARWQPVEADSARVWTTLDGDKSFRAEGNAPGETWLGYQHRIPTQADWRNFKKNGKFVAANEEILPRLIADFYAYNAGHLRTSRMGFDNDPGLHWVGDLILEADLTCEAATTDDARATLRLIKGGRTFDCRINVTTGEARLEIDGVDMGVSANTSIRAGSQHQVSLANVDCQLTLWVDGDVAEFDGATTYDPLLNEIPTEEDLTPARIGTKGVGLQVDHLRILRDVYYIACKYGEGGQRFMMADYETPVFDSDRESDVAEFLSNPAGWPRAYSHLRTVEFPLREDEFLMLGDNSPRSKDSRLWEGRDVENRQEYFVKRSLLVGKAVFVYWPHSWNRIPGTGIPFPFFPNFARMKFVR